MSAMKSMGDGERLALTRRASEAPVLLLRDAARWSAYIGLSFLDRWARTPDDIVALYIGWVTHPFDEFPDQASPENVRRAAERGRWALSEAKRKAYAEGRKGR